MNENLLEAELLRPTTNKMEKDSKGNAEKDKKKDDKEEDIGVKGKSNASSSKSKNFLDFATIFSKLSISTKDEEIKSTPSKKRMKDPSLDKFIKALENSSKVIVLVGAGVSVSAGIPDFRSPGTGLYSQLSKYKLPSPEAIFEIGYFKQNPEPFRKLAIEMWANGKYKPTLGHYFIKLLDDKKKLLRCYTQNIDSLESMTGLSKEKIVAAHGNFDSAQCIYTKKKVPIEEVRQAYLNTSHDELNKKHGTRLVKPDIVFFG